jgi:CRISPR-associated endonuclease/helicase Cas3
MVIFDEAQMLPVDYLTPCMAVISELITNYGVTAVLCSATKPLIQKYGYKELECIEIADNPDTLAEQLKRVNYSFIGSKTDNEIIKDLTNRNSALVILNSRKHAFTLYALAKESIDEENLFYLSTLLTPSDRSHKIAEIRRRLSTSESCFVISTQLIEAGVDVDFPIVFRSLAGIDSIIQAGGRANREGKLDTGEVVVFEPTDSPIPRSLQIYASLGKEVIDCLKEKAFELDGVKKYFELLNHALERDGALDKKSIISEFEMTNRGEIVKMNFEKVAKNFKLIENDTHGIIIPCDESAELIKQLRNSECSRGLLRKLQKFSVNIYESEFTQLRKDNALEAINGINILITATYYTHESGLDIFSTDNRNAECFYI